MASGHTNAVLKDSEVGLQGLSVATHGDRPAGMSPAAQQGLLLKPGHPRGPQSPRGWWYCWCPGPWASTGCLHVEVVPSRATSDPACWDCAEAQWRLWVGWPVGCHNPGNCNSAGVEASLVHQSFCFILPDMGYFEYLWITLRLCQCLWIFINNKHAKKKKNLSVPKAVWSSHMYLQ